MNDYAENSGVALSPLPSQGMTSPNLPVRERALRRGFWRVAVWFIVLDVLIAAFVVGVRLRQFMWIHTDTPYHSMRFDFDIENAHHWGSTILRHATAKAATAGKGGSGTDWKYFLPAYFELYQQVIDEHPEGQFGLDYTPARLLVAALWVRHEKLIYPHVNAWVRPYPYTAPLLWFNTICEMIAALGAFLLVRHWVWRGTLKTNADPKRADSPVPTRAWVVGLVAALLIWFNPAMLYDAHVFPQWEVWLLPSFFFAAWFASRGNWLLAGLVVPIGMMLKGQLAIILPIFILWPLFEGNWRGALRFVIGFLVGSLILVLPWLVRADFGWLKVSFIYPTGHWRHMAAESDNLAAILENFGWTLTDPVFTIRARWLHLNKEVPIKTLLVSIYTVCLVLCAWGMSRKNRRNDPAFLIALTAPWLLMFATLVVWP